MTPRILSLNIGRARLVIHDGKSYSTAIGKSPVAGPLWLGVEGFTGDKVADTRYHGGPEQAACVYPHENYAVVAALLEAGLPTPSFGENLTTLGLLDDQTAIGDTYRIGSAIVQVSKPRQPCVKLARKHNRRELVAWLTERCLSGFYLRVLEEGEVTAGEAIELIDRPHPALTVAAAMRSAFGGFHADAVELRAAFAACEHLSLNWRKKMKGTA